MKLSFSALILAIVSLSILTLPAMAFEQPPGKISGYVFLDGSGAPPYDQPNGMHDAGEKGFSGVKLGLVLHYLNSEGAECWGNLQLYKTTDAQGRYEFVVFDLAYFNGVNGYTQALDYQIYIVSDGGHGLMDPANYVCTTDVSDPVGQKLSKHANGRRAAYSSISIPVPQDGSVVFNWPGDMFPEYTPFMGPTWPTPPDDWSASERTEYLLSLVTSSSRGTDAFHRKHVDFGFAPPPEDYDNPGTGTPGYWKNHPQAWPVDKITIGGLTYTKEQAIAIIKKATSKDMRYVMFAHLASAKLNVMIGNDPTPVAKTIPAADAWMAANGSPGTGTAVNASSHAWAVGEPLKDRLDAYNNGLLGVPHRD